MEEFRTKVIATRVTVPLAKVIEEYLKRDAHVSPADFFRDAIREKLKRDAPALFKSMLEERKVNE